jgi:hypothetical protein
VVLVDVEVPGRADLEVEQPVVGQRSEEVVVEPMPVSTLATRCRRGRGLRDVGLAVRRATRTRRPDSA